MMTIKISIALYLIFANSICSLTNITCHRLCTCTPTVANCSGQNLTYVPRMPKTIRMVNIRNTNLKSLDKNALQNLTFNRIIRLHLNNNSLKYIHPLAFYNISYLIGLRISEEPALDVGIVEQVFQNMNTTYLRSLQLTQNDWTVLPRNMFQSFVKGRMQSINLQGNAFKYINGKTFVLFSKLKHLNLENNRIEKIVTIGLQQLMKLNLRKNQLKFIPDWCSENGSNVPNLSKIDLSFNYISRLDNLKCLPRLSQLSLANNLVENIPPNAFTFLLKLQTLNLNALGNPVKSIQNNAFNLASLKTLTMSNCKLRFRFMKPLRLTNIFAKVPNLEDLDIEQNILPNTGHGLSLLLRPLLKIKQLHMDSCKIYELPVKTITNFKYLDKLTLRGNRLQGWKNSFNIFGNSTSIKYLDISGNNINFINDTSFPEKMLSSLERLNLAYNPFYCTCDQKWFADWLRQTNVTVEGYPQNYRCVQPAEMRKKLLSDYKPTTEECKPFDHLLLLIISITSFGVLLLCVTVIVLKCQNNIRNYLYLIRVTGYRKLGYLPINGSENFEYHAFVVYCDADREWVHNKFIKKLEEEESMRLCIHHRDFDVGDTISGNIDKFLEKSWKVVVVMSNEFAKSEWCQWEIDIVQERRRRYGRDVFLLVMLKDITSKYMTSPLRMLLDSTPYLKYQHGIGEDLFWKAAVEGLRKSVDNPPVSVLK